MDGISIIIPAHNEEKYIQLCVEALLKQTNDVAFATEIIVVDNNSSDNTLSVITPFPVKIVTSYAPNAAGVRNEGAKQALYDILAFIDGDCVPCDDWLTQIYLALKRDKVGGYGGPHISPKDQNWLITTWFPRNLKHSFKKRAKLPGSNFSLKAELFRELGGFNEKLISAEDDDLSNRIIKKALCIHDSKHTVEHYGYPDTLMKIAKQQIWHGSTQLQAHGVFGDKVTTVTIIWIISLISLIFSLFGDSFKLSIVTSVVSLIIPMVFTINRLKMVQKKNFRPILFAYPIGVAYTLGRAIGLINEIRNKTHTG